MRFSSLLALACTLALTPLTLADDAPSLFVDHGVVARAASSRGVAAVEDAQGNRLVIAMPRSRHVGGASTMLLVINVETGEAEAYPTPASSSAPFAFLHASNNRFYTSFGNIFAEFDIDSRAFTFHERTPGVWLNSLAEGPDGVIYGSTRNKEDVTTNLIAFDPKSRTLKNLGYLHKEQEVAGSMIVDEDGWLYAGIGTAESGLVAFHTRTGEWRSLAPKSERRRGTGFIRRGQDGLIYGRPHWDKDVGWYRLAGGEAVPVASEPPAATRRTHTWQRMVADFPSGGRILDFDLGDRRLSVADPDGSKRVIQFEYDLVGGAGATSLTLGPDGRIYGSTSHPMRMWRFDPATGELGDLGGIPQIGNGNFTNLVTVGEHIYGIAYMGGHVYRYDPAGPWNPGNAADSNPRHLHSYTLHVARSRAAAVHPDGYVLFGGLPTDGMAGGALGIHRIGSDDFELIPNEKMHPGHSTIDLRVLPNGDVVGATTVSTTGGARQRAEVGMLYVLDWQKREVVYRVEPLEGASTLSCIELGADGLIYGVSWDGRYFVFDPATRSILHRGDFGDYGNRPIASARQSLIPGPDGAVYAITDKAVVRIDPKTWQLQHLADTPVNGEAGLVYHDGRLYFTAGERLFSFNLQEALRLR